MNWRRSKRPLNLAKKSPISIFTRYLRVQRRIRSSDLFGVGDEPRARLDPVAEQLAADVAHGDAGARRQTNTFDLAGVGALKT